MKTKSVSKSAFSTPRVLLGLGLGSIGVSLAILALVALPTSSALAVPQCSAVSFEDVMGEDYGEMYVTMTSDPGCTIFYTIAAFNFPANPTHSGGSPGAGTAIYPSTNPSYEGVPVPVHQKRYLKAVAYNPSPWVDSAITAHVADNTQQ
jgi:hypothetical protein